MGTLAAESLTIHLAALLFRYGSRLRWLRPRENGPCRVVHLILLQPTDDVLAPPTYREIQTEMRPWRQPSRHRLGTTKDGGWGDLEDCRKVVSIEVCGQRLHMTYSNHPT